MKIIRVFPRRTSFTPKDDMAVVGSPALFMPAPTAVSGIEVHVSCTFTWDKPKAEYLAKAWRQYFPVKIGGPAYDDPCDGFTPGLYLKQGVVITSRGCNHKCPWCLVWRREGALRLLPVTEGNIEQSNSLLQCPRSHIDSVLDMLTTQSQVCLAGGLESSLVSQWFADRVRSLRVKQVFLACDTKGAIKPLRKAINLLGLGPHKTYCYALLKFNPNETISEATERMVDIWQAGATPFAQLYQPPDHWIDYPLEWRHFQRTWSRPAAMRAFMRTYSRPFHTLREVEYWKSKNYRLGQ